MAFERDEALYVMSVAARMVGVHPQTLRYYERIGLVRPARSPGRQRLYSLQEIERLRQVHRLVSELGVNLAGVEVILRLLERIEALEAELAQPRQQLGKEEPAQTAQLS